MIASEAAIMRPLSTAAGRKLLIAHVGTTIEAGDVLVLIRGDGDAYRLLRVAPDRSNPQDPSTLASFLLPADVDAAELQTALALAVETNQAKPKRRKRAYP